MRVALFGGSFNPPHLAHQLVALAVLETHPVDELWFIPCFQHPFEKELASFAHRLAMTQLMAAALGPRVLVTDIERRLGGPSRTLVTVKALQETHPAHAFALVIGADLKAEAAGWYGADELQRLVSFLVVGRSGFAGVPGGVEMPAISSSEVRDRIGRGDSIADRVPAAVARYIGDHQLYLRPDRG